MKSEFKVDLRTSYCTMVFKRSTQEKLAIRQQLVRYAQLHGIRASARKYGASLNTVRQWKRRFEAGGTSALADKSRAPRSCPHKVSKELEGRIIAKRKEAPCFGPKRLRHFNPSLRASESAIYRVLKAHGLIRKQKKKYKVKRDLRAVKAKYNSLTHHQEDVKHLYDIPYYWAQMLKYKLPKYEYTIRDTKSGFTVVAFANEYNEQYSTILTETYLRHLKSFGIDLKDVTIQTDNGSEFGAKKRDLNIPGFVHTVIVEMGANQQYIPPRLCNANADVESFHSTIELELFNLETFTSKEEFFKKTQTYQYFYNFVRPNFSKAGKTPIQIIMEDRPHISPEVLNFPVYDLDALFRQKMELSEHTGVVQSVPKLPE